MRKMQVIMLMVSIILVLGGCTSQASDVTINLPASFAAEGKTQADYDAMSKENGWKSIILNEDGSLTYVMTQKQHELFMDETKKNLNEGLDEMIASEEYPNFVSIKVNDNYTDFEVVTKSESLNMFEAFSTLGFYMASGMYNALNGTPIDNCRVVFINEASGEIIQESNSRDMQN